MIDRIHRAKSGTIFFITFGLPIIIQLDFLISMSLYYSYSGNPSFDLAGLFLLFIPVVTLVCMAGIFTWFWSISIGLQDYLDEHLKEEIMPVKLAFWIPIIYIMLFVISFVPIFPGFTILGEESLLFVVPAHFTSMGCILYVLYFSAKTLKTCELKQKVKFGDFIGDFMLLWFYPIGVWSIQKRINVITQSNER